jgi:uncharacterized protein (DUF4213/DUF364 family)
VRADNPSILKETVARVGDILGSDLGAITVERAVIGLFFTGVKLDAGTAGACATPRAAPEAACCPMSAAMAAFPRRIAGCGALEAVEQAFSDHAIRRAVGVATLNALADLCWRRRPHPEVDLCAGVDAFDATEFRSGDRIVLVGAFVPFLKELKRRGQPYLVVEQDPTLLKPDELPFYRPAAAAREILPEADVMLITGSALVNETLEDLLAFARPAARVTVVGPTVGLLPDALLARGADILGGVRITAPDDFLDLLAEAGGAPQFLGRSAQKIVLARRKTGARAA